MRLDFETILGIIFFIVFFVLPVLNRKKKAEGGDAADPKAPGSDQAAGQPSARGAVPTGSARPVQPPAQDAQGPATAGTSSAPGAQPTASTGRARPVTAGSIDEALEEIRARVRQAQQQESSRRGTGPQRGPVPQAASAGQQARVKDARPGSLVSAPASRVGGDPSGQPGGLVSAPPSRIGMTGTAPSQPPLAREGIAAPLEVARRGKDRKSLDGGIPRPLGARQAEANVRGTAVGPGVGGSALAMNRRALVTGMIWHEVLSEPAARRRLRRTRSRQARP